MKAKKSLLVLPALVLLTQKALDPKSLAAKLASAANSAAKAGLARQAKATQLAGDRPLLSALARSRRSGEGSQATLY